MRMSTDSIGLALLKSCVQIEQTNLGIKVIIRWSQTLLVDRGLSRTDTLCSLLPHCDSPPSRAVFSGRDCS